MIIMRNRNLVGASFLMVLTLSASISCGEPNTILLSDSFGAQNEDWEETYLDGDSGGHHEISAALPKEKYKVDMLANSDVLIWINTKINSKTKFKIDKG